MNKVLLIEDDLPLVRMYQIVLQEAGFEVITALYGEEGLEKIKRDKPDMVLLDLVLPKKDGRSVLKEINQDSELSKIPVCCLSVLHQKEDIDAAKHLGAREFLVKTEVDPADIVRTIKKHLKSSPS